MGVSVSYYQLMSGDTTRDFSGVMLDFGVAIVGPGNPGHFLNYKNNYTNPSDINKIEWLTQIKEGDKIILHKGLSTIQAIGEVVEVHNSIYQYSNCFADIDGWDLQHFCYVNWKKVDYTFDSKILSRSTINGINIPEVRSKIEELWLQNEFYPAKYPVNEIILHDITRDEIEQGLIYAGIRIEDAENIVSTISHVSKLAQWYQEQGSNFSTSEHEIRAFLVVPFLKALGWSYQKMSIEFNKVDIALFDSVERDFPRIIIETKSMWSGSQIGFEQAIEYLKNKPELNKVEKIIITDGLTYWLYDTKNLGVPLAYMSLKTMWPFNPAYPKAKGMVEFIKEILNY